MQVVRIDAAFLRDWSGLRVKMLAEQGFKPSKVSGQTKIRKEARTLLDSAMRAGWVEAFYDFSGKLRGAIRACNDSPLMPGMPDAQLTILYSGADIQAEAWMKKKLNSHAKWFGRPFSVRLDSGNRALLPFFRKHGVHIQSVLLGGCPQVASRELKKHYGVLDWGAHPEFEISEVRTETEVDAVIQIMRKEFARNPQFGDFVGSAAFLAIEKREILKNLHTNFLIHSQGKIVGHFGVIIHRSVFLGKSEASLGINFSRSIQGKGLAKFAYAKLLHLAAKRGVDLISGGTSQKPVLKLSKIMKRPLLSYQLQSKDPYFPASYFKY